MRVWMLCLGVMLLAGTLLAAVSNYGHGPLRDGDLEQASWDIEARIRGFQQTPRGRARLLRAGPGHLMRPADGPVTSRFGQRYHPILHRTLMHTGVDIRAGFGEAIHAAAAGDVVLAGPLPVYGNVVVIDHGGRVATVYGHCSELLVSTGQTVRKGQAIARVGATGLATGPHLHFEVRRNGTPADPLAGRRTIDYGRP